MNKLMKWLWPFFILLLVACGNDEKTVDPTENNPAEDELSNGTNQDDATPLDDEVLPGTVKMLEGIKVEENPKYPVGSKVMILADHLADMEGAEGVIVGAYDTTAYSVEYLPTSGGEKVVYKWLIDQELEGVNGAGLDKGIDVVIRADHVEGMEGASGEIVDSNRSTVYMVNFKTTSGKEVKNYKWLTEDELSAAE